MRIRYLTADVFTDRPFGGNPLAVFPDASALPEELLQVIAGELNLSETVFVLPPETRHGTRRARIFTPTAELPFAGHPTVGTAFLLVQQGELPLRDGRATVSLEEGVGLVEVEVHGDGARPESATFTAAKLPQVGPEPPAREELAAMVGLEVEDLSPEGLATEKPIEDNVEPEATAQDESLPPGWTPQNVSAGVPFLHIPLRNSEALSRARLDTARWQRLIADAWAPQIYLIVPPSLDQETLTGGTGENHVDHETASGASTASEVRVRMFAPGLGVPEDPATGSAAAALAGYLFHHHRFHGTRRWVVRQGLEIGRPSTIHLEADGDGEQLRAVRVGGRCVPITEAWMEIPDALLRKENEAD